MNDNDKKLSKALARLAINKTNISKCQSIISEIQDIINKLNKEQVKLIHAVNMEYDERQVLLATRINECTREKNNFTNEHNNVLGLHRALPPVLPNLIPSHVP